MTETNGERSRGNSSASNGSAPSSPNAASWINLSGSDPFKKAAEVTPPARKYKQKARWKNAVNKVLTKKDEYSNFDYSVEEERAIRHTYHPETHVWTKDEVRIKMEKTPFGEGAMRNCFRMKKLSNWIKDPDWESASNLVAKNYKEHAHAPREQYFIDIELQMVSKYYGELYNKENPPKKVDFMMAYVIEMPDRYESPLYAVERHIDGHYEKYNNNTGFVSDNHRLTPQAFTHFTFIKSKFQLLVCDVQGVGDLYTDPQIHTVGNANFGEGNLGVRGIALFFHTHECNPICRLLNLPIMKFFDRKFEDMIAAPPVEATKLRTRRRSSVSNLTSALQPHLSGAVHHKGALPDIPNLELANESFDEVPLEPNAVGYIHLGLAKCHEQSRFDDGEPPNLPAALYHFDQAAMMGVPLAQKLLARKYMGLGAEFLPDLDLEEDVPLGLNYAILGAERGSRECMVVVADAFSTGKVFKKDYGQAAKWYRKAQETNSKTGDLHPFTSAMMEEAALEESVPPIWVLQEKLAKLLETGGPNLKINIEEAAELYNSAAEEAMAAGKGKLSQHYFEQAEMVWSLAEGEEEEEEDQVEEASSSTPVTPPWDLAFVTEKCGSELAKAEIVNFLQKAGSDAWLSKWRLKGNVKKVTKINSVKHLVQAFGDFVESRGIR